LGGPLPGHKLARKCCFVRTRRLPPPRRTCAHLGATVELYGAALRLFGPPYSGAGRSCEKPARIVRSRVARRSVLLTPVPATSRPRRRRPREHRERAVQTLMHRCTLHTPLLLARAGRAPSFTLALMAAGVWTTQPPHARARAPAPVVQLWCDGATMECWWCKPKVNARCAVRRLGLGSG